MRSRQRKSQYDEPDKYGFLRSGTVTFSKDLGWFDMGFTYSAGSLFDEAHQIHASKLNRWKYFTEGETRAGTLTWSSRGNKTGSISFRANLQVSRSYIELDYSSAGNPIKYKVFLERVKSNLGKGVVWYFKCPMTGKRCRILYGIGEGFFHRDAFSKCFYETQTYSRKCRSLYRLADHVFGSEKAYHAINKKHFKKTYANKQTKRYQKLMSQIKSRESLSQDAVERLFIL